MQQNKTPIAASSEERYMLFGKLIINPCFKPLGKNIAFLVISQINCSL